MTTAPVPRLIGSLAIPTIISMLVTSFYVMADTYFVGKINTQSTAAVGISFSIMAIIQAFGFFCGHGSGNFISRRLGARDYRSAERMAATGFFCAFFIGCLIALIGLLFLGPICLALGSTPTILPYAKTYLGIILLGAPFMASSLVLNNQMRFQGNAVYAMIGITVGAFLNIALDPLLIFVFDMGIAGAAWSTFISQVCSFTILIFMDRKGENIRINYRYFTPTPAYLKEIVYGGSPSLCRQGLVNRRVLQGFKYCVKVGLIFLAICSLIGYIYAPEVVSWFRKEDPQVIAVGAEALRWQLITLPLGAWVILCNMLLQTIRQPKRAVALSSARQGLFFIPLILVLPYFLQLQGVEMCQAVSDLCSFLMSLPLTIPVLKSLRTDRQPIQEMNS